ncbi:SDR family oxidoreductase [Nitriliruptor alkaliphilus]|uniref:SDR family oxidoreductase n=1 Tax=Nitriliruptor alkaliphilus TaxID=427918 RepID=UPI0006974853|nr:SDR family NAD(P)-dependent oxidoreductase [Nitriliruptor alkaliphilus]
MQLRGAVVVITGAGSGIGAAMARRFAVEGAAALLLADLDLPSVQRLAAELGDDGCRTLALQVDVAVREQVEAMIDRAEAELGPVDLLCSNAGIGIGAGLDATDEQWERAWQVNVLSQLHGARAVVPRMVARGSGYLLHTASAAGLLTTPGDAPYTATKHAAVGFAEWLAVTYGGRGIGVSTLCPQAVNTPLLQDAAESGNASALAVRAASAVLEPEDVADAVVAGLAEERFLILPHPEVADHVAFKAADRDRWIGALRRALAGSGTLG